MTPTDVAPNTAPDVNAATAVATSSSVGAAADGVPDLWFELPPGFTEFDLAEDPEERMLRMADAIDRLFVEATPVQKLSLVVSGEYALQTLIASGGAHASSCLVRMPDGRLSQGTLCVMVESPDVGPEDQDRRGAAKRTAVQWSEQFPEAEAALIMLPYGPAALCIRDQDLQIPGAVFGLDTPTPALIRQVQFCVPLRTGPGSALFTFMTEDVDHWDEYLVVVATIMKSVSADEPDGESTPVSDSPDAGETEGRA
ncbi:MULTISPECIES: hypothetical protein [unclassified Streptomyces]|uniref:hypothetical protein n=1 Tax=unclassified Streptomyces TaxID=2593676 RepID=UPI002DD99866|nr:hypothetical protein [Streptomyces sp. NBC_01766]WSC21450.1 hypothetical protein OIE60_18165 [Streptomyces sp. NBC_01766]